MTSVSNGTLVGNAVLLCAEVTSFMHFRLRGHHLSVFLLPLLHLHLQVSIMYVHIPEDDIGCPIAVVTGPLM